MSTLGWVAIFVLTAWVFVLHRIVAGLTEVVVGHAETVATLVRGRGDLLAEEIAKARADLGEAVERLDVGGFRERMDPEERRAD